ncbi:hypothetical protein DW884_09090 [Ruminococcus sp. AM40-10AC]|nr:hypothetical protein DW884_09090 [Ruminococcus sp. AM40-10AC]
MKQERRQNGRCNRVARLKKPDGLSEARDFSHGFFIVLLTASGQGMLKQTECLTLSICRWEEKGNKNSRQDNMFCLFFVCKKPRLS